MTKLAFSAPGKAFFAGGYLVLDSFPAYVVALSARMHAVVEEDQSPNGSATSVSASSPQFKDGEWQYVCPLNTLDISYQHNSSSNPFIEASIRAVLAYINPQKAHSIKITIYSDDQYHSQSENSTTRRGQFVMHSNPISQVPKTGLGSSAALTVVVVTALLAHFGVQDDVTTAYKLSQLAHCTAQGKIGSGFDVASAAYGSIIYTRFSKEVLDHLTDPSMQTFESVQELVKGHSSWADGTRPCSLPEGFSLLMGDVQGGSETPKLVSQVMEWKKKNPKDAEALYERLNSANVALMKALETPLAGSSKADYKAGLADNIRQIRRYLKELTVNTGVPIEPDAQTEILDSASELEGVIGGVVPGAGGYDAIALLVETDKIGQIQAASANHSVLKNVKWFNLREESEGVRPEEPEKYPNLE